MKFRWSLVGVLLVGLLGLIPLRPLGSVHGEGKEAPPAGFTGRYQILDGPKEGSRLLRGETVLFDSATGRVWTLNDAKEPFVWKLVIEAPK